MSMESRFKHLNGPVLDLAGELDCLVDDGIIEWHKNQICLTTIPEEPDNYKLGVGSLYHNWANARTVVDDIGNTRKLVERKDSPLREHHFTTLCSQFRGTLFEEALDWCRQHYTLHRVRLMRSDPHTCLSWHNDSSPRLHYPIKTDVGARMVVEDVCFHMPANTWWWVDTTQYHTAFNGSRDTRIHLVACIENGS